MPLNQPGETKITSGTYAGNNTASRAIPHGLSRIPKLVSISSFDTTTPTTSRGTFHINNIAARVIYSVINTATGSLPVTASSTINFHVGEATSYPNSANQTGYTYVWAAIG